MTDTTILPREFEHPPVRMLSKAQRRVLGVLVEKGITTPEYYPMTLKALTAACNQKSNRMPLTEYSEDDVLQTIDELRGLGLAAVVHTESGRTERYRHYVRKQFPWNEAQLAILIELWLRGRQSVGDLRSRASRMHAIDSLDQLREELRTLLEQGFVQATGPLTSRGVEVDHNFYKPSENQTLTMSASLDAGTDGDDEVDCSGVFRKHESVPLESFAGGRPPASGPVSDTRVQALQATVDQLEKTNELLCERLLATEQALSRLTERFETLRRELGGV
jgi:uncharacterized protein